MRTGFSARAWLVVLALATAAAVSRPAAADDRQECLKGSREAAAATIAACTRAIESGDYKDRDLSTLYHTRGYSWSQTSLADRIDRAFKDYTEAIRIDPEAVGSLLNRAHIYNQRHDYDRAIADVNQAFEGGLSNYGKRAGYGERGYAYQAKGDNDRAIADYTESIQLDASNYVTLTARGATYLAKGDLDRAIADYDQVIALYPKYALAYYSRAFAYRAKGDVDRVIADCSQAIALYPQYRDAYFARGYAYQTKGDFDRAIADYDQMIALDPNDGAAYSNRAMAYLFKGDFRRAIADFDPEQVLSWLAAAVFLAALIWLCCRRDAHASGRWSGPTMIQMCENELVEIKRRNAALDNIAAALERRSSG
ncbi:tetratricopeptide repeat protein [Bradyrhizobium cajani]|uniref:Tetratricopeptide repeat protein n=1 Tax=Bradyrhizobium cajani TaxID=1928661 RepID=A0A844TNZ4_9BRAD|nr:tetratricopeptide repeat protein [Bradyrhizobium cajani]MCP3367526.1 tetratricopeptide repeat protein [Bradyrhizobium cajani]MVT78569.1 tetratricopeptide repeat protein [Bradyrhizobium cajani]